MRKFWQNLTLPRRLITIGAGAVALYAIIYMVGSIALVSLTPTSSDYSVVRSGQTVADGLVVKKTGSSWSDEGIKAENKTGLLLSVGEQVQVQKYWWFGEHVIVNQTVQQSVNLDKTK